MRACSPSIIAIAIIALTVSSGTISAQSSDSGGKSTEEFIDLFSLQKTRGLTIAPSQPAVDAATTTSTTVAAIEIVEIPKEEQVNINISFDFDSSVLREDQKPQLANLCEAMKVADVAVFKIIGHTDSSGSESYNDQLSLLRAQEVKRFMVGDCGLEPNRLEAVGVGERYPFNSDDPKSDENRRVEFQVVS